MKERRDNTDDEADGLNGPAIAFELCVWFLLLGAFVGLALLLSGCAAVRPPIGQTSNIQHPTTNIEAGKAPEAIMPPGMTGTVTRAINSAATTSKMEFQAAVVGVPTGVHSVACDFQVPWYRQVVTVTSNNVQTFVTNWIAFRSDAVIETAPTTAGPWVEYFRTNLPAAWLGTNMLHAEQWLTLTVPITNHGAQNFFRAHYTLPGT